MARTMISMKLHAAFLAELDEAAKRRGISRTTFVERGMARVMAGDKIRESKLQATITSNFKHGGNT